MTFVSFSAGFNLAVCVCDTWSVSLGCGHWYSFPGVGPVPGAVGMEPVGGRLTLVTTGLNWSLTWSLTRPPY